MPRKVDRRVLRTRKLLAEAMLSLLLQKDYDDVTIQDITEAADLNRATFYLHYGSKEELLVAALEARFEKLVARINKQWGIDQNWDDPSDFQLVYEHAAEYAPLYKVLLGDKGRAHVIHRIIDYITEVQMATCQEVFPNVSGLSIPLEVINRHIAGSLYSLLSWWIANDMPHSAEYMAHATHRLCMQGAFPLFAEAIQQAQMGVPVSGTPTQAAAARYQAAADPPN